MSSSVDVVEPVTVEPKGSYGVALVWSDAGRTSDIYTYDALRTAAMSLRPQHSA